VGKERERGKGNLGEPGRDDVTKVHVECASVERDDGQFGAAEGLGEGDVGRIYKVALLPREQRMRLLL
jgi:hypothetical protein